MALTVARAHARVSPTDWDREAARVGGELRNAAGVSFYEHLFDDWSTSEEVVPWRSPHVTQGIWPLWEQRPDDPKLAGLAQQIEEVTAAEAAEPDWDAIATFMERLGVTLDETNAAVAAG